MKIILILFFFTMQFHGFGNDSTSNVKNEVALSMGNVKIDTARHQFHNDTINFTDNPKIAQIIYAEKDNQVDKILTYLFPILMLLLGVGIDRFILYRSENKRIKKIGKRWIAELKGLEAPISNQIDSYTGFIKNYCNIENRFDIPDVAIYQSINGKKFGTLGKEDLYEYLEIELGDEMSIEVFQKITNVISTLEFTYEQMMRINNDFKTESSHHVDSYNSNIQIYFRELYDLEDKLADVQMDKKDYDSLTKLYQTEINDKMPQINIFETEDRFVRPSLEILKKYNRIHFSTINSSLIGCLDAILGLKNEKIYIKIGLEKTIDTYRIVSTTLIEVFEKLNKN